MGTTYSDLGWVFISDTDTLQFAPMHKDIISFLAKDKLLTSNKARKTRAGGRAARAKGIIRHRKTPGSRKPLSGSGKRGFASMDPYKRTLIASKGGKKAHALGVAHRWTSEEARKAGL